MASHSFVVGILIVIFIADRVNGVQIQFYGNRDYTRMIYESNSTSKCTNMPADKKNVDIYSIKTDTCLMVYLNYNCQCSSRKFDLNNVLGWDNRIRSFHICNEDIGGSQLNIDITKYYDADKPIEVPDVLESYRDVCKCINVPQYVQNMTNWSVNNFGNDFLAYYESDCSENKWKQMFIPAGHWGKNGARSMHEHVKFDSATNMTYKIHSIGPDPNSKYFKTSCIPVTMSNKIFDTVRENVIMLDSLKRILDSYQQKYAADFVILGLKNEEFEKKIGDLLKAKAVESELKLENQRTNLENIFQENKNKLDLLNKNLESLSDKNQQLEKTIQQLLNENQALKEKAVESEFKLENQYRNLEDSFEKLKDEFALYFNNN